MSTVARPRGGSAMFFRQYDLACLSLYSYMIGDTTTGRAVVVDPQRDVDAYVADAAAAGLRIERVIETHFHADFLSGHLELAAATGAVDLVRGSRRGRLRDRAARPRSAHVPRRGRPRDPSHSGPHPGIGLGRRLRAPGMGAVGGVDRGHAVHRRRRSPRPAHVDRVDGGGPGTRPVPVAARAAAHPAGRHARSSPPTVQDRRAASSSTAAASLDDRRPANTNYALRPMSVDEFVAAVTEGQMAAPLVLRVRSGRQPSSRVPRSTRTRAGAAHRSTGRRARRPVRCCSTPAPRRSSRPGTCAGSINVGLDGRFAEYAGESSGPDRTSCFSLRKVTVRRARSAWPASASTHVVVRSSRRRGGAGRSPARRARAPRVPAARPGRRLDTEPRLQLIDVRSAGEVADGAIPGARELPLPQLLERLDELDPTAPTVVYCAGGYRSSIAASTFRAHGFRPSPTLSAATRPGELLLTRLIRLAVRALLASPLGLVIGLSLGALGGGGSILAIPVLVYGAGQNADDATATSLMLVGVAAAVGVTGHWPGGACAGSPVCWLRSPSTPPSALRLR